MSKLIILVGIANSGKSTFAASIFNSNPDLYVRMNRDKLREQLFCYTEEDVFNYYLRSDINKLEKQVTDYENVLIKEALYKGKTVIVDATHLQKKYIDRFKFFNVDTEVIYFNIDLHKAVDRNSRRSRKVDVEIIKRQYQQYISFKDNFLSWELWCYMKLVGDYPLVLKEHPVYKGYFGGSDGEVYSKKSPKRGTIIEHNGESFKRLVGAKGGTNDYKSFVVCTPTSKKSKMVHKFIYECFYKELPNSGVRTCVSHLDGNSFNNKPNNLASETYSENLNRKIEHGTDDRFYKNSRSSLSKDEFYIMKNILKGKFMKHEDIADVFGVSRTYVSKMNGKIKKYES